MNNKLQQKLPNAMQLGNSTYFKSNEEFLVSH